MFMNYMALYIEITALNGEFEGTIVLTGVAQADLDVGNFIFA